MVVHFMRVIHMSNNSSLNKRLIVSYISLLLLRIIMDVMILTVADSTFTVVRFDEVGSFGASIKTSHKRRVTQTAN